ncbi:MAG: hypothetical protein HY721_22185 [Planctomycetes bacterium]|nr:hypothetical protein [Planctomycetota bacterium]
MLNGRDGASKAPGPTRPDAPPAKPGVRTSELWTVVGTLATALAVSLGSENGWVQIAALGSMTCLGCVLGAAYIWSRTVVKAPRR